MRVTVELCEDEKKAFRIMAARNRMLTKPFLERILLDFLMTTDEYPVKVEVLEDTGSDVIYCAGCFGPIFIGDKMLVDKWGFRYHNRDCTGQHGRRNLNGYNINAGNGPDGVAETAQEGDRGE